MYYRTIIFPLLALFCWNCAQLGSPTGGPRDEDPPRVVESDPPNYSTRFETKKIFVTFDEYIVLENVNQELIVSPPMEEQPEVRLKKKTMIIQFEEALKDSTTYTFNFGSAIKDLHEGNKLLNYEYVFSTGDVLDSLSVKGTLKYAENLTVPEDPISIMLYEDLRDSVPLTNIPLYVGRSDDSGVFSVNNLRPGIFKVFALKDGNNNFLFDSPTEEIAYLDSNLIVNAEFARRLLEKTDSIPLFRDTVALLRDTTGIASDSLKISGPDLNSIYIDLLLFMEETEIQYISDYSRDDRRKLQMVFASPLTDSFFYRPILSDSMDTIGLLEYFSPHRDSLTLWILDSLDYKQDTLNFEVNFTVKDTANQFVIQTDTLLFSYREKRSGKKKSVPEDLQPEKLKISTIRKGGDQDLHLNLVLNLNLPLKGFRDSLISLYHIPDSVEVMEPFKVSSDTLILTRGWISADWKSAAQYKMVLYPGAITSIYPLEHDTINVSFKTRDMEYYGQILLTLENVSNRILVQLINKDKVIRELVADASGLVSFSHLIPQEYHIKVIHDLNGNGKWDTGKYMEHLQPEPVEILPMAIKVRSNWDHDVTMKLEK